MSVKYFSRFQSSTIGQNYNAPCSAVSAIAEYLVPLTDVFWQDVWKALKSVGASNAFPTQPSLPPPPPRPQPCLLDPPLPGTLFQFGPWEHTSQASATFTCVVRNNNGVYKTSHAWQLRVHSFPVAKLFETTHARRQLAATVLSLYQRTTINQRPSNVRRRRLNGSGMPYHHRSLSVHKHMRRSCKLLIHQQRHWVRF